MQKVFSFFSVIFKTTLSESMLISNYIWTTFVTQVLFLYPNYKSMFWWLLKTRKKQIWFVWVLSLPAHWYKKKTLSVLIIKSNHINVTFVKRLLLKNELWINIFTVFMQSKLFLNFVDRLVAKVYSKYYIFLVSTYKMKLNVENNQKFNALHVF